jgi:hypothetical protein
MRFTLNFENVKLPDFDHPEVRNALWISSLAQADWGSRMPAFRMTALSIGCWSYLHSDLNAVVQVWRGSAALRTTYQSAAAALDTDGLAGGAFSAFTPSSVASSALLMTAAFHWRAGWRRRWRRSEAFRFLGRLEDGPLFVVAAKIPQPQTTSIDARLSGTVELEPGGD